MVDLVALWLPILLSAVFVFVASSVIHMALPLHKNDYGQMPQEDRVLDALRGAVPPGQYRFPYAASMKDCGSPAMQAKFQRGPIGTIVIQSGMNMGKALGQWFVFCLVIGVFVAYVTGLALPAGADYLRVFRIAGAVAVLAHAIANVHDSIWKGVTWGTTLRFALDGVIYGLLTAGTFAWLWPASA
ncbi:MAG: hypothetical protein JNL08_08600 [Planctomycetes bacterium]|nr:hypothetical protein [Planctomycetota bacterium]